MSQISAFLNFLSLTTRRSEVNNLRMPNVLPRAKYANLKHDRSIVLSLFKALTLAISTETDETKQTANMFSFFDRMSYTL